ERKWFAFNLRQNIAGWRLHQNRLLLLKTGGYEYDVTFPHKFDVDRRRQVVKRGQRANLFASVRIVNILVDNTPAFVTRHNAVFKRPVYKFARDRIKRLPTYMNEVAIIYESHKDRV